MLKDLNFCAQFSKFREDACPGSDNVSEKIHGPRGEIRPRQTRQLPRAVDLKGRLLSCQSY